MRRWLSLLTALVLLLGTTAALAQAPQRGGTIVVGLGEEPETLDPHKTTRFHSYIVLHHIVEPLFTLDEKFNVIPLLAEGYDWSADGLTLTLYLKKGILFHNGQEMKARDVKASYERYFALSPMATYMPESAGGIYAIETPDDYTVVLRFRTPKPLAMYELADAHMAIMPADWLKSTPAEDIGIRALVGTGPLKFVQWLPGDRIVTERFEGYRHGPSFVSNKGPAYVDRMVFRIIPEPSTLVAELTAGEVDISFDVPPSAVAGMLRNPNLRVETVPTYSAQYMAVNMRRPIFQDIRVRQALAHAINKEGIARAAWHGVGHPISSLLSPATIGYWPGSEQVEYKYNPERAKALLDEAGWRVGPSGVREKDGRPLELTLITFSNIEQWRRAGEIVQAQLGSIGIRVRLETAEVGAVYDRARVGDFDIGIFRNTWWLGHPYLYFLTHSENIGSSNYALWGNPELDRYLMLAQNSLDPAERERALNEAQRIVIESAVWVPLVSNAQILVAKKSVGGVDELVKHPWWPPTSRALELYKR